jgi:hypothetical protein
MTDNVTDFMSYAKAKVAKTKAEPAANAPEEDEVRQVEVLVERRKSAKHR